MGARRYPPLGALKYFFWSQKYPRNISTQHKKGGKELFSSGFVQGKRGFYQHFDICVPNIFSSPLCISSRYKHKMPRKARADAVDDHVPQDEDPTPTDSAGGSLYEVLGVERTASQQEIRKAYHRLALQLHPDKNPNDENANEKFQKLQKVISILGDPEKRALYDQTGCIDDEELSKDAVKNLYEFMRSFFRKVTEEDIIEFETNYRGSEQERKDLLEYYRKCKGKMNRVYEWVLCSDPKLDNHRFKDIIDSAISAGELQESKAYRQWAVEVMKTRPPANPLKRPSKKRKDAEMDIRALISQNQANRKKRFDSLFSSIVSEYGNPSDQPEPTEEEFEATRQKMEAQNLKRRTHKKK